MCDCGSPLQCADCLRRSKEAIERHLEVNKEMSLESARALIRAVSPVHVRFMLQKVIDDGAGLQVGDTLQSPIYYAENRLALEPSPQPLLQWAADLGVPKREMRRLVHLAENNPASRVHVWREGNVWYGRGKTTLNLTSEASLVAHLKRKGVEGTRLSDIYAEYEQAYMHIHTHPDVYICEGYAWHRSVACSAK